MLVKMNLNPKKTVEIFNMTEQMSETRSWKKMRGLIESDKCRMCGEFEETVQHLLAVVACTLNDTTKH